jgi:hypothetical protein
MNEPDTPSGTDSGRNVPGSGQTQDSSDAAAQVEEDLKADLRKLVETGKDLTGAQCRGLLVLPQLEHVFSIAGPLTKQGGPNTTSPNAVQRVLIAVIDRLADPSNESDEHWAQLRKLLFGLANETKGRDSKTRWKRTLAYYNENINPRTVDVTIQNFHRRIYENQILPPIVHALLDWENSLSHTPAIELSAEYLLYRWRTIYWALFRLHDHLASAAGLASRYLAWKNERDAGPLFLWSFKKEPSDESAEDYALKLTKYALFHITILRRFAISRQTSSIRLAFTPELIDGLYGFLEEYFAFSELDQQWLNQAIGSFASNKVAYLESPEEPFAALVQSDPKGRLIAGKFLAIADACNEQCQLHTVRDQGKLLLGDLWQPNESDTACPLHTLQVYERYLSRELTQQWGVVAQVFGGRRLFPGAIPPAS